MPPMRIRAGIEASTITSEGTCRFVMPLSEFTIARAGPLASSTLIEARISSPPPPSASRPAIRAPRPLFGDRPAAASPAAMRAP